jgi:large subunit ribosomal protein L3
MKMMLGRKIGMTQVYSEDGTATPVSVIKAGPIVVVSKKSKTGKDGYAAIKVGFEDATKQEKDGNVRWRGLNQADVGVFTKAGIDVPKRCVREFRIAEEDLDNYEVGQIIDHSMFTADTLVDVSAISKGAGFAGVMKRHNFRGGKASHGVHESYRGGGSIGASAYPAKVFKGQKMAGRHGGKMVTTQNLRLVEILEDDSIYLIKGAVPGKNGGLVEIRPAVKSIGRRNPA